MLACFLRRSSLTTFTVFLLSFPLVDRPHFRPKLIHLPLDCLPEVLDLLQTLDLLPLIKQRRARGLVGGVVVGGEVRVLESFSDGDSGRRIEGEEFGKEVERVLLGFGVEGGEVDGGHVGQALDVLASLFAGDL
jgi:hypothetical protein